MRSKENFIRYIRIINTAAELVARRVASEFRTMGCQELDAMAKCEFPRRDFSMYFFLLSYAKMIASCEVKIAGSEEFF
jgi:hypothetical protein